MNMPKKIVVFFILVTIALLAAVPVVSADDRYSDWSTSYSGVQYQYVNQFGGNDWDGVRWINNNSGKVSVRYKIKLKDGRTTDHLIYLEKGETSGISSIASGERISSINVKKQ